MKGEVLIPFNGQILCVHHHLQRIDPDNYRSGNTRLRGRGDPPSDASEDQSGCSAMVMRKTRRKCWWNFAGFVVMEKGAVLTTPFVSDASLQMGRGAKARWRAM